MSGRQDDQHGKDLVCVDEAADVLRRGIAKPRAHFYTITGVCGNLPCPPYVEDRPLTCVVCSR